jgi:hypothetical protein
LQIAQKARDSHFPTAATTAGLRLHFQCLDGWLQSYILKWLDACQLVRLGNRFSGTGTMARSHFFLLCETHRIQSRSNITRVTMVHCMSKSAEIILISLLACSLTRKGLGQSNPAADHNEQVRVIVAPPDKSSADVIAIPPDTSWRVSVAFQGASPATPMGSADLAPWLEQQSALNGLQAMGSQAWHLLIEI